MSDDPLDLEDLQAQLPRLITLAESESVVISCYCNPSAGYASYRNPLDTRARTVRRALPTSQRRDFEEALGRIEEFLASELEDSVRGVAIFSRGGASPFFLPLQFRLPLPDRLIVDTLPSIYELIQLKDTFDRYVLLTSTETRARIIEVSLGSVTRELWTERPELRKRVGREWTREHFQSHQRNRSEKFLKEKIEILDRLVSGRQHTHLILAGDPRAVARVHRRLPKRLLDQLIDVVPMHGGAATADVVLATLARFSDYEQRESLETAGLLLKELRQGGLAASGTEAVLRALVAGQVDVLVLAEAYGPAPGWSCRNCPQCGVAPLPTACPGCGQRSARSRELRELMVQLAERSKSGIEIVRDSDVLLDIGEVGCLLRYLTPEQHMVRA